MEKTTIVVFVVVLLSLVGVLGDFFLKLAGGSVNVNLKWFFSGLIIYSSTAIGWFFVMRHIKLGTLGVVYGVSTILALSIIGIFFFKEPIEWYEVLGLILGLSSVMLLARFG